MAAADAVGITASAISQWPDELPPRLVDRVLAALVRKHPDDWMQLWQRHIATGQDETNGAVTCEELRPDKPWRRIPDESWPHPAGRPVLDFAAAKEMANA